MNENERDTHFQGFAKLLWQELASMKSLDYNSDEYDEFVQHIAQRSYDLVEHALQFMPSIEQIPDLTEWPTP